MNILKVLFFLSILINITFAQYDGDVIINEIANSGTKKKMYTGGEYVELLVVKEGGVNMAGWYLTDLSGPGGTPKETEGYIKFSDEEGSVFNNTIPQGTYIVICFDGDRERYGASFLKEDANLDDGNNQIVLFAYDGESKHLEAVDGTISLTGKDNIALASAWQKKAAVDVVTWGGATNWLGCDVTELPLEALENGKIVYFKPETKIFSNNSSPLFWVSTDDTKVATPGTKNPEVNDSHLQKK